MFETQPTTGSRGWLDVDELSEDTVNEGVGAGWERVEDDAELEEFSTLPDYAAVTRRFVSLSGGM